MHERVTIYIQCFSIDLLILSCKLRRSGVPSYYNKACPLDFHATVSDKFGTCSSNGLKYSEQTIDIFTQDGVTNGCHINWDPDYEKWSIGTFDLGAAVDTNTYCDDCTDTSWATDSLFAANWLFGQCGQNGLDCPTGVTAPLNTAAVCENTFYWLESSAGADADASPTTAHYCQNDLWAALCPMKCNVPCPTCRKWHSQDNDAAATIITIMLG